MPDSVTQITVVPVNEGVTTCVLGFLLVCLVFPALVRNRPQYYAALAFVVVIVLLHALGLMIGTAGFQVFAGAMTGLLQAGAIVLIILSVGGLRVRELAGELKDAYEVMRRGQPTKDVIIPIRGGAAGRSGGAVGARGPQIQSADEPQVYRIDPETGEDLPPEGDASQKGNQTRTDA